MRFFLTGKRGIINYSEAKGAAEFIGDLTSAQGLFGQKLAFKQASALYDISDAGSITISTVTATGVANLFPANALVLAVTSRVTQILTGAVGTWSLGVSGATTRYGTTLALAAGTTSTMANHLVSAFPTYIATAVPVVFTSSSGTWTGGKIRVTVHYLTVTAETS